MTVFSLLKMEYDHLHQQFHVYSLLNWTMAIKQCKIIQNWLFYETSWVNDYLEWFPIDYDMVDGTGMSYGGHFIFRLHSDAIFLFFLFAVGLDWVGLSSMWFGWVGVFVCVESVPGSHGNRPSSSSVANINVNNLRFPPQNVISFYQSSKSLQSQSHSPIKSYLLPHDNQSESSNGYLINQFQWNYQFKTSELIALKK